VLPGEVNTISQGQLQWLEKDLAANKKAEHIFVMGHSPAFPAGPHVHSALDARPAERDKFWKVLAEYNVDAYLCAHEHLYNSKVASGVRQILTGSCGAPLAKGFGGCFYHFAKFTIQGPSVKVEVIDNKGAVMEKMEWTRSSETKRATGPFEAENITPVPEYPSSGQEAYLAAYRAFYEEKYIEAVGRFHALLLNEKNLQAREGALSCMAVSCMKTDNEEMAEGIYEHLIATFPESENFPGWCASLGKVLADDLEWEEAAEFFIKASKYHQGLEAGELLARAGECWELSGNLTAARECYQSIVSLCPGSTTLGERASERLRILEN